MPNVGIRELKARASEIVRAVREEGAVYEVTVRGEVAARLVPTDEPQPVEPDVITAWLRQLDELAEVIGKAAGDGEGADEIMRRERREP